MIVLLSFCAGCAAVQEERQRAKEKGEVEVESTTSANSEMPIELILEAELAADAQMEFGPEAIYHSPEVDQHSAESADSIYQAMDRQLMALVDWAKHIPHFVDLSVEDQVTLLRVGQLVVFTVRCLSWLASFVFVSF